MLNVLIVEDAPEVRSRLVEMLSAVPGVAVVGWAAKAQEAIALAEASPVDVVVLDVLLRDGDRGYAVLRELARRRPDAQVIVLSNFGWSSMREGFLNAGARAYFDKAFEFREAVDWVAAAAAARAAAPAPAP